MKKECISDIDYFSINHIRFLGELERVNDVCFKTDLEFFNLFDGLTIFPTPPPLGYTSPKVNVYITFPLHFAPHHPAC